MDCKFPNVKVRLVGEDGNAFSIMGKVTGAMRKAGISKEVMNRTTKTMTTTALSLVGLGACVALAALPGPHVPHLSPRSNVAHYQWTAGTTETTVAQTATTSATVTAPSVTPRPTVVAPVVTPTPVPTPQVAAPVLVQPIPQTPTPTPPVRTVTNPAPVVTYSSPTCQVTIKATDTAVLTFTRTCNTAYATYGTTPRATITHITASVTTTQTSGRQV